MKVALLTDGIWPDTMGGMQKHSYYLSKYLAKRGAAVDVYTSRNPIGDSLVNENGCESAEGLIKFVNIVKPVAKRFPGHYLWELFHLSKMMYERLQPRINDYNIIYAQGLAGWYVVMNKKIEVPVVLNFHGLNMFQRPHSIRSMVEQEMFRPVVKKMLMNSDYVQSLGGHLTQILLKNGVAQRKIFELGIGIEKEWLLPPVTETTLRKSFVFIGRFDKVKGIYELNDVLRSLLYKYDFDFQFVGPIPNSVRIKSDMIRYHGEIRDEEGIKSILRASDFLVLPSYSEGMPTVILEAMACGNGIIATNVGAVSELVSALNGILIPPSDKEALRNAFIRAIQMDQRDATAMKQLSAEKVRSKFIWDGLIDEMLSFFQKIKYEDRSCLVG
jgi:glycosyltransferase involved in cell wall biosynthesis